MNIEARLDDVRAEYLHRMTQGDSRLLRQVEAYTTARHGKMLRPRMLLAAAATLGDDHLRSQRTLFLAVAVEMLHNASLLHDDVIDHASSRRGQPSVNSRWGSAVAVLVGDYLLTQIMELLDQTGDSDATRKVNATVRAMVEAELLAQEILNGREQSRQDYLTVIDGKTANLFALAAGLGNPLYRDFGLHYGRIFQLRDDIADGEATPHTAALLAIEEDTIKQMENILNI
ncbi:MAG: polyprenyl synthetase family protein [Bacteroidales bacterium]|nr:polyprenyl synthetase family protein [Bacteroidales bacterium]